MSRFAYFSIFIISFLNFVRAQNIYVNFEVPKESPNKISISCIHPEIEVTNDLQGEILLNVMEPGTEILEETIPKSKFIIRSSDLRHRLMIMVDNNSVPDNNSPFTIFMSVLGGFDRELNHPVELQHSPKDFIWIEQGKSLGHFTDEGHIFTLRDKNKDILFSVRILGSAINEMRKDQL
jgi:hypothetical protein